MDAHVVVTSKIETDELDSIIEWIVDYLRDCRFEPNARQTGCGVRLLWRERLPGLLFYNILGQGMRMHIV